MVVLSRVITHPTKATGSCDCAQDDEVQAAQDRAGYAQVDKKLAALNGDDCAQVDKKWAALDGEACGFYDRAAPPDLPGRWNSSEFDDVLSKIFTWWNGATIGTLFTVGKRGQMQAAPVVLRLHACV